MSKLRSDSENVSPFLESLYAGELNPVAPQAQKKVPVPEGLDLEVWINEPVREKQSESSEDSDDEVRVSKKNAFKKIGKRGKAFVENEVEERRESLRPELTEKEMEERRQRRLQEEADNPYYLKRSSKDTRPRTPSAIFSSPDSPNKVVIPGLTSSDRYLRQQKESEKLTGKKSRKSKSKKEKSDEESGITEHQVNRDRGEMPEGTTWSDDHDSDKDDKFRALDIDVISPLAPEEKLPTFVHRQSGMKKDGSVVEVEKLKKKKKTKDEENGEDSKKKKKKSTKDGGAGDAPEKDKKKKKKKTAEKSEEDLLNIDDASTENVIPVPVSDTNSTTEVRNDTAAKPPIDDLDFWMGSDPVEKKENERPQSLSIQKSTDSSPEKDRKPKELKKKKKSRSKLRSHSAEEELIDEAPETVDKSGYEEAFGLEQETNPSGSPLEEMPASRFVLLTEDKNLKVEFDSYISDTSARQIAVNFVFTNRLSDATLKSINFEVVDAHGLVVDKSAGMEIPVKFAQMPPKSNWNMTLIFTLKADAVAPQTVRGTITYMKIDSSSGGSSSEMKDFKLALSCAAFMLPVQISTDEFMLLLESGQLNTSAKKTVDLPGKVKFADILARIGFYGRFYLVEHVGQSATFHAMTILQQRVAMLVKFAQDAGGSKVVLEAKSPDQNLTEKLLGEIVDALGPRT